MPRSSRASTHRDHCDTDDIFADLPDAQPGDFRVYARPKKYVDPLGDSSKKRKQTNLNPMQQRWFERHGWEFEKTEWRDYVGRKHDIWTFGDWLALDDQPGSVLVQTCRLSDYTTRLRKAEATTALRKWLERGNRFQVHGWTKDEARNRWVVRRVAVVLREGQLVRVEVDDAGHAPA